MKRLFCSLFGIMLGLIIPLNTFANQDLVKTFQSLEQQRKGPFGLNFQQSARERVEVINGSPEGNVQFLAAYRNELAESLINKFNFYTANLYTTNYYELMGEYVYGDKHSSHELNHQALLQKGSLAMPKAYLMVQHWALEKEYLGLVPNSKLAQSFLLRGISGSEYETEYAQYFFNFYFSALTTDSQYLSGLILAKESPLFDTPSLEKARNLISEVYESAKSDVDENSQELKRLYKLRNTIHNQASPTVISDMDQFMNDYPSYQNRESFLQVRQILVNYYNINAQQILNAAKKMNSQTIQDIASQIIKKGSAFDLLVQLSKAIVQLRGDMMIPMRIPYEQKTNSIYLINLANMFISNELIRIDFAKMNPNFFGDRTASKNLMLILLNQMYAEGFLIKDNWNYFSTELTKSNDLKGQLAQITDAIGIASDTLTQAYNPALAQWIEILPKMQYFVDSQLKSSSISIASQLIEKLNK